ncbi:HNH endonuclease [Advenella mimigardefordensis]|uniref:HNH endonuklease domain-containing protein n=1 Tax=Advenella mimigardefordensis (strain DSM 17166 / LMG 22922 / DPN7) TaxID=1247726 RepID=W0PCN0_ADVMD|nr:HNH endonuclease signature motif containing protein [Advenella mimigardefordensis]AHG63175.1 HNH endonuklease domain-containing protein [Advenella mimigardefordensis DPN7]
MPQRPQRPCRHKGCNTLHRNKNGHCDEHQTDTVGWRRTEPAKGTTTQRGYGYRWQQQRERILKRDGYLCQECYRHGKLTLAKEVDHIVNKAMGGTDDDGNLESKCIPHHRAKTQREAEEARNRAKPIK